MRSNGTIERLADTPRLSEAENRRLLVKAGAGDSVARDKILRHSGRLVKHLITRLDAPERVQEDLMQEALIGLSQAIDSYKPGLGAKWSTYSYVIAHRKMVNQLLKEGHADIHQPLDPDVFVDHDTQAQPEAAYFGLFDKLYIQEHLTLLPEREAYLAESYWGIREEPMLLRDIGKHLGVSAQRASSMRGQAIDHLRASLSCIPDFPPEILDPFTELAYSEYSEAC